MYTECQSNTGEFRPGFKVITSTKQREMTAYDKLPKWLRKELRAGEINWASSNLLAYIRKHKLPRHVVVDFFRQRNHAGYLATYPGIEEHLK